MNRLKKIFWLLLFQSIWFTQLYAYQSVFNSTFWAINLQQSGVPQGMQYHVLEKDTFIGNENCHIILDYSNSIRLGIFKEDTVSQKVFIYENNNWELYYDFSLKLDDKVLLKFFNLPSPYIMRVYKVDSIFDCTGRRKVLKLIGRGPWGTFEVEWIEGIGSSQGIYYQFTNQYFMQYILEYSFQGYKRTYCQQKNCGDCPELPIILKAQNNCITDTVKFELDLLNQPLTIIDWDLGDTIVGNPPFYNSLKAIHKYSFADSFKINIRLYDTVAKKIAYYNKWITIQQPLYNFLPSDTVLCSTEKFTIKSFPVIIGAEYLWFGNITGTLFTDSLSIYKSGKYILRHKLGSCPATFDTVTISLISNKLVELGLDKTICEGEIIPLSIQSGYQNLKWSTGDTMQTINTSKGGDIWVTANYSGCEIADTINIQFHPTPIFSAIKDTSLCLGDSILLSADTAGGNNVIWWDNSVNPIKEFKSGGYYWNKISNAYCSVKNTFTIDGIKMPSIDLGQDTIVCNTDPFLLPSNTSSPVIWFTGDTGKSITVKPPAVVWVKSFNKQCVAIDTIKLTIKEKININAGIVDWCFWEAPYIVDLTRQGLSNYKFAFSGEQQDTVFTPEPVTRVIEDKNGCTADYQLIINPLCDENIYIPTAFTPNTDGLNDFFQLQHPMLKNFRIKVSIYNGYGELVFASESPDFTWDGTYKGVNLQTGVFLVLMNIQMKNGRKSTYRGNLTLLR